jgi:hypothetical protein
MYLAVDEHPKWKDTPIFFFDKEIYYPTSFTFFLPNDSEDEPSLLPATSSLAGDFEDKIPILKNTPAASIFSQSAEMTSDNEDDPNYIKKELPS